MTSRAELLHLADRVEREGPSAALRLEVVKACGWKPASLTMGGNYWQHPVHGLRSGAPDPLHSIDAAASLVPPAWIADISDMDEPDGEWCCSLTHSMLCLKVYGNASTEPRARTAAALRAIAQEMPDE